MMIKMRSPVLIIYPMELKERIDKGEGQSGYKLHYDPTVQKTAIFRKMICVDD